MKHELKTINPFFTDIMKKVKNFEIRKNDRDFKIGDILVLKEFIPCEECDGTGILIWDPYGYHEKDDCRCKTTKTPLGTYTGNTVLKTISYILDEHDGLEDGYIIMGLK
jgi:hypothetical protein